MNERVGEINVGVDDEIAAGAGGVDGVGGGGVDFFRRDEAGR